MEDLVVLYVLADNQVNDKTHRFIDGLPGALAWLDGLRVELQRPLRPAPAAEEPAKLY